MQMNVGVASASERPLPLDTIKDKYNKGFAGSSECPRAGSMLLENSMENRMIVNTSCNTWRCVSCRDRNLRRFKAMVSFGCSVLERSMLITITYAADSKRLGAVGCVTRDWQAFWRIVHKDYPQTKSWGLLRVMELTKKGIPHFHVIAGKVVDSETMRCYGTTLPKRFFGPAFEECECWSHRLSRVWRRVQAGESYIVHTIPVASARGAGAYLGKYLGKELDADRGASLGMVRRYSANSLWPREKRSRLMTGDHNPWRRAVWKGGKVYTEDMEMCDFERRRTDRQVRKARKDAAARFLRLAGGSNGNQIESTSDVRSTVRGGG